MRKFLLLLILFLFVGCQVGPATGDISELQERIDEIAKKVEGIQGTEMEETEEKMTVESEKLDEIENKLNQIEKKMNAMDEKLDNLESKYLSHLKKFHQ